MHVGKSSSLCRELKPDLVEQASHNIHNSMSGYTCEGLNSGLLSARGWWRKHANRKERTKNLGLVDPSQGGNPIIDLMQQMLWIISRFCRSCANTETNFSWRSRDQRHRTYFPQRLLNLTSYTQKMQNKKWKKKNKHEKKQTMLCKHKLK